MMTPKEFLAYAEKHALQLHAIRKEVPPGSNRWLLLGFEYGKRSRKYKNKFLFPHPVELNALREGPIVIRPVDAAAAGTPTLSSPEQRAEGAPPTSGGDVPDHLEPRPPDGAH
jgi:hypothetical protein